MASIAASVASIGCILVMLWVVEVDGIDDGGGRDPALGRPGHTAVRHGSCGENAAETK
jgi:hypothetical protein